ncbi:hypothetical protein GIB67_006527 [Kingdonia uniflora]|uniref:Uncharacterized protein n=1 Tax=Kingdonia uniflora TaxID=39325 RepID=A0A7J7LEU4_9MAGN|nr:hypothetical protein GIB67_006527 [Kingdonia uniflora]
MNSNYVRDSNWLRSTEDLNWLSYLEFELVMLPEDSSWLCSSCCRRTESRSKSFEREWSSFERDCLILHFSFKDRKSCSNEMGFRSNGMYVSRAGTFNR